MMMMLRQRLGMIRTTMMRMTMMTMIDEDGNNAANADFHICGGYVGSG